MCPIDAALSTGIVAMLTMLEIQPCCVGCSAVFQASR
jgi:hypothetical protein